MVLQPCSNNTREKCKKRDEVSHHVEIVTGIFLSPFQIIFMSVRKTLKESLTKFMMQQNFHADLTRKMILAIPFLHSHRDKPQRLFIVMLSSGFLIENLLMLPVKDSFLPV